MNTSSSFEKYNLEKHPSEKNNFETVYKSNKSNKSNSNNHENWFKPDKEKEDINSPHATKKIDTGHIERLAELNAKLDECHAQKKSNSFVLTKKKRKMLLKNQKKLKHIKNTKKKKILNNSPISYDYTVLLASPKVVKKTRRRPRPAWKPTGKALKIRLG